MASQPELLTHRYLNHTAPVFFLTCSLDGRIIEANHYAEQLAGRPLCQKYLSEIVVDFKGVFSLDELIRPSDKENLLHIQTESGLPQSLYFRFERLEDTVLVLGRLDAQELEIMRRKLISLNHDLSNLTRQLQKQNAQLKKLNADKNRFLGMAAHDLRKPIGLVLSYSEFLMEEAAPLMEKEQVGFLNTIHTSCGFMQKVVDDYLDISAIESGQFQLRLELADVTQVVENSLKPVYLQAARKNVQLKVRTEKSIPKVFMDASKIEQALMNLAANAVEHTQPGMQVAISISSDDACLAISVEDQGEGMTSNEMDALFKPFKTAHTRKTHGEKSTGLGMIITRKIVEAHQGKITVKSQPEKGTTVQLTIPRREQP